MRVVRQKLPIGVAAVVFGTLDTVVVSADLRAKESIEALRRALKRKSALFAVIWI